MQATELKKIVKRNAENTVHNAIEDAAEAHGLTAKQRYCGTSTVFRDMGDGDWRSMHVVELGERANGEPVFLVKQVLARDYGPTLEYTTLTNAMRAIAWLGL